MTKQEIINVIEGAIVANGTNDITADVLRPVLVSMVTQINDAVGVLNTLGTNDKSTIVKAINEVLNNAGGGDGIVIHTGTVDPNITPPAVVNLGDFYNRTFNGSTVNFYIFNGQEWFPLKKSANVYGNDMASITSSYTVPDNVSVVRFSGNLSGQIISIPNAEDSGFREITIVNTSENVVNLSKTYYALEFDVTLSTVQVRQSITIKSNPYGWTQIR